MYPLNAVESLQISTQLKYINLNFYIRSYMYSLSEGIQCPPYHIMSTGDHVTLSVNKISLLFQVSTHGHSRSIL